MKIAMIGVGHVGSALARKWGARGHSIYLGARDPMASDTRKLAADIGLHASIHGPRDAASQADLICLATPWNQAEEAIRSLGDVSGKIIIDCTNPLKPDLSGLTHGFETSGGERVQAWAPGADVVKCFNSVGYNIMEDPILEGRKTVMFYCGNSEAARDTVRGLVMDVGFEPLDAGPLVTARLLEPYALLWISSAYKFGMGREFALSIVRRGH